MILLGGALAIGQVLIGGVGLLFALPAYVLLAVVGFLSVFSLRQSEARRIRHAWWRVALLRLHDRTSASFSGSLPGPGRSLLDARRSDRLFFRDDIVPPKQKTIAPDRFPARGRNRSRLHRRDPIPGWEKLHAHPFSQPLRLRTQGQRLLCLSQSSGRLAGSAGGVWPEHGMLEPLAPVGQDDGRLRDRLVLFRPGHHRQSRRLFERRGQPACLRCHQFIPFAAGEREDVLGQHRRLARCW